MRLSPDELVFWRYGFFVLNSTIVTTWALMLFMTVAAQLVTRNLLTEGPISRWQGFLEIVVTTIQKQIKDVGLQHPEKVSRLYWHLVSVYRGVQPLCDSPLVRTANRFALDNLGAGDLSVCRRPDFWHPGTGGWRLSRVLFEANFHHAAV